MPRAFNDKTVNLSKENPPRGLSTNCCPLESQTCNLADVPSLPRILSGRIMGKTPAQPIHCLFSHEFTPHYVTWRRIWRHFFTPPIEEILKEQLYIRFKYTDALWKHQCTLILYLEVTCAFWNVCLFGHFLLFNFDRQRRFSYTMKKK